MIEVAVQPHPSFQRRDDDIMLELPITIDEAVLGGKIEVPTVTGRVALTIPKGANTGQTLRLRGKGVRRAGRPRPRRSARDLAGRPAAAVDAELASFMRSWRERHAYDPRADLKGRS